MRELTHDDEAENCEEDMCQIDLPTHTHNEEKVEDD